MKDNFSPREVAVLVEELRGEIRTVAEGVVSLQEDMTQVKERLSGVENRLIICEDAIRISIPDIYKQLTHIKTKIGS